MLKKFFKELWDDDGGIVAFEYLAVATISGGVCLALADLMIGTMNLKAQQFYNATNTVNTGYTIPTQTTNAGAVKYGSTHVDTTSQNQAIRACH